MYRFVLLSAHSAIVLSGDYGAQLIDIQTDACMQRVATRVEAPSQLGPEGSDYHGVQ